MGHFGRSPITRVWLLLSLPGVHPELPGPGRAGAWRPQQHPQPVLPAGAGLGQAADGVPGRRGDRHRVAGRDHRRVLGGAPRPPGSATCRGCAYTSEEAIGQIYVPWINWLLLVAVLTLVLTFRSSAALAYA